MAFLETNNNRRKERFSLLLLEPGEIYFEDYSAFYYPAGLDSDGAIDRRQRGRIKVSSKSVVFDPQDVKYPILKFAFRDVTLVEQWQSPLLSRIDSKDQMFMIETEQVTEMKENYAITPYVFVKETTRHLFGLIYQPVHDCLAALCQLQRAATLPRSDQVAMINAIVSFRQHRVKFDTRWLEDLYETVIMETKGDHITPLLTNPGHIVVTSSRLYFQPFNNVEASPVLKIQLKDIRRLIRRRFQLKHIGLELYCHKEAALSHLYLAFVNRQTREELVDKILRQPHVTLEDLAQENMTLKWQNGLVTNYDYLKYLNSMADRSINDLTQYPVFPWVLSDYTSKQLDLSDPASFRDLSKPIGALNPDRLDKLLTRYREMPEPRFLYGSHYSSPGYVLFYLARVAPEYMLCLHNGRFDQPDRMFNSVADAWDNCMTSFSNFMELIPEFYGSSTDFLSNHKRINFGTRQDGRPVGDVELPPWAEDASDFVKKMRDALECDYVSQHLHDWIDLIFGYKQHGSEAELAYNVFYYLTYEGSVDMDSIDDPNERAALEAQIAEFGQTPKQLFTSAHPRRKGLPDMGVTTPSPSKCGRSTPDGVPESDVSTSLSAVVCDSHLATWRTAKAPELVLEHQLHKDLVTEVKWNADGTSLLSVSKDTFLKIYSVEDKRQVRSVSLSNMALSSLVITADSKTVITGCWDNSIYIYSLEFGRTLQTLDAHDDAVSALCLHDNLLVSSSWDSTVKLWRFNDLSARQRHASIMGEMEHESGVTCCAVSCDGSQVAAGTVEGDVCLWDVSSCYLLRQQPAHTGTVHAVAFSPDAQQLISCGEDGFLQVIDVNTGTEIFSKSAGQDLRCVRWDGETVLVGCGAGNLLVCDLVSLQMESVAQVYTGAVTCLDLCPGGKLATGGMERTVKVWSAT